jgi:hypothetical protein
MGQFLSLMYTGTPWANNPTLSVCCSSRQNSASFHALLSYVKENKVAKDTFTISFRDVFTKDKVPDVKKLVQRGLELKKTSKIACFKVRSRGDAPTGRQL